MFHWYHSNRCLSSFQKLRKTRNTYLFLTFFPAAATTEAEAAANTVIYQVYAAFLIVLMSLLHTFVYFPLLLLLSLILLVSYVFIVNFSSIFISVSCCSVYLCNSLFLSWTFLVVSFSLLLHWHLVNLCLLVQNLTLFKVARPAVSMFGSKASVIGCFQETNKMNWNTKSATITHIK